VAQRAIHQGWLRRPELHAFPKIGTLGVGDVDLTSVKEVLEPMVRQAPVSHLVRVNIESVLDLARAEGQRTTDNPARWDLLKHTLPARKGARAAGHFRALSYSDIPALLKDLQQEDVISEVALRFTILTVARTEETAGCRWPDIDFAARTRTVQILKGGEAWQHMVPDNSCRRGRTTARMARRSPLRT
jgi:integrase